MQVKCIPLTLPNKRCPPRHRQQKEDDEIGNVDSEITLDKEMAWVIDGALSDSFMTLVNEFRLSLPLDAKRPTVKRRFFSSAQSCPKIREALTTGIESALIYSCEAQSASGSESMNSNVNEATSPCTKNEAAVDGSFLDNQFEKLQVGNKTIATAPDFVKKNNPLQVHVLAYMRFLEYDTVGGRLDPHTDGNKICEDTQLQSTHTMLLYLRDCERGGDTLLLEPGVAANKKQSLANSCTNSSEKTARALQQQQQQQQQPRIIEAVQPRHGRILLFPHPVLHEGSPVVDVPKLCLRAEVALYGSSN